MPSVFRFLTITGMIAAVISGTLYVLATRFEPDTQEEVKAVPGLKVRKQ